MIAVEPRGLDVVAFNAVGAMPNDRSPLGVRVLRAAHDVGCDLLIGVECDDLDRAEIRDVLDPDVWWFRHRPADHRDGGFIAGRRHRTRVLRTNSIFGAPGSPVNAPRDILRTRLLVDEDWHFTAAAIHVPRWKEGGEPAALAMVRNSQRVADLLAGDFNIRRDEMVRRYPGREIRSAEVMHFVARGERLQLGQARPFDLLHGTTSDDHPGVRVTVRPAA